jgi:hypothetical protein
MAGRFASMQQPADFFCKEFLSGQHRLEDPVFRSETAATARRTELCQPSDEKQIQNLL